EINESLRYYDTSLFAVIPALERDAGLELDRRWPDREVRTALGPVVSMGSWIGGDRDGNPFVTAEVVAFATSRQATIALGHHLDQLWRLAVGAGMSPRLVPP